MNARFVFKKGTLTQVSHIPLHIPHSHFQYPRFIFRELNRGLVEIGRPKDDTRYQLSKESGL